MKPRDKHILIYLIVVIIISTLTYTTGGREGGWGDGFNDGNECLNCHHPNQNLSLGAGYSSITIGTSEPIITLKAQVDMTEVPFKSDKYGVMLVTSENGNLSDDGWTIISDPNQNQVPSNYIERNSSYTSLLQWRIINAPGLYTIRVFAMYGSQGREMFNMLDVNVVVPSQKANSPPKLSNPKAVLLTDGKTYDFEITYTDIDFDLPTNITVNISGLGSFEMEEKSQGPYNATRGVTFYYLTELPQGRYSYHFAASDGLSWNSTTNTVLRALEEDEDIDVTPLIIGISAGFVVITAIYILRKR